MPIADVVDLGPGMPPLSLASALRKGDEGDEVARVQEWLSLHLFGLRIDGSFGWATEQAVRDFQSASGLPVSGVVDEPTFALLVKPAAEALRRLPQPAAAPASFGDLAVAYAQQHLAQHAREVGGQNRGPWVRLYLKGREAKNGAPCTDFSKWAWCAGFTSRIWEQAAITLGTAAPLPYSWSVTELGRWAKDRGLFVEGQRARADPSLIRPGSLMLMRRSPNQWHHVGIVTAAVDRVVRVIEGNSYLEGDDIPYGHEVCRQTRAYDKLDFVALS